MFPSISSNNIAKSWFCNAKLLAKFFSGKLARLIHFSNFQNFSICKLGGCLPLAKSVPFLVAHVGIILSYCSKKKVAGVNASRNIAPMQHGKTWWNFTVKGFKRNSVREFCSCSSPNLNLSVPFRGFISRPKPAGFSFDSSAYKAFCYANFVSFINSTRHCVEVTHAS